MLNLTGFYPSLTHHQDRFFDHALPEKLSLQAFYEYEMSSYPDDVVALGLSAWEVRATDEYRSMVDFSHLLQEACAIGMPYDAISCILRSVRDEACHVELCKRMVLKLGGSPVINQPVDWSGPASSDTLLNRILYRVSASLCIGETLSIHFIDGVRKQTLDELSHAVLTRILKDESFHSQLGWSLLETLYPSLSSQDKETVAKIVERTVSDTHEILFSNQDDGHPPVDNYPFGYLSQADRHDVFVNTMDNIILKRFQAIGIQLPERAV